MKITPILLVMVYHMPLMAFPDVKDLDIDFYTFSLYKTYGPHLGLLIW